MINSGCERLLWVADANESRHLRCDPVRFLLIANEMTQGNVLPVTPGKTDHSCSTAFCNSCAIHCGSLSGANRIGDPIFTRTCHGRASFFSACFSSNNPSILMGTT